jgi:hypothetical protein
MDDTENRGPGRPRKFGERLERVQILVTKEIRETAESESQRRGISISEVYREWIEKGRKRK